MTTTGASRAALTSVAARATMPRTRHEVMARLSGELLLGHARVHELDTVYDDFRAFLAERAESLGFELDWDDEGGVVCAWRLGPDTEPTDGGVDDALWAAMADLEAFRGWLPVYHRAQHQLDRARTALADTGAQFCTYDTDTARPRVELHPDQLLGALRAAYQGGCNAQSWPVLDEPQPALPGT
ncbi:MAG: hypothetical protein GEV09_11060 [Pseudonocardiaceae bacterium]|nr:hypothetical protein [Pseudonocardiaceae bacterium]